MRFKKILSLFVGAAVTACVLCGCKINDPMEKFYNYYYVRAENDKIVGICIASCSLETEEIQVPDTISGQRVVSIGSGLIEPDPYKGAFEGCPGSIKRIIIPEGVYEIGERVFADSISIENVVLPQSLEKLGERAFYYCESLDGMTIPENITEIPEGLFMGCKSLKTVSLSEGITYIGQQSFQGCTSLEKIELPSTVTSIEAYAFVNCDSLTEVKLNEGLSVIGNFAFANCEKLTDITIPDSVTEILSDAFASCEVTVHYKGGDYSGEEILELYSDLEGEYTVY